MKFIQNIIISLSLVLGFAASAQTQATPQTRWLSLINGYNVLIPTNQAPISLLSTNVEYTRKGGQIVYSYSNTGVTNGLNDAFQNVRLQSDANGDAVANATLIIAYGNTNLVPITNLSGFVTNWVLQAQNIGSPYVTGSANVYPVNNANSTNLVTINLVKSYWNNPLDDNVTYPTYRQYETDAKNTFSVTFNQAATGGMVVTNIPAVWLQGVRNVIASLSATNAIGNGSGTLINFIGISQPQL